LNYRAKLRDLPAVERILKEPVLRELVQQLPRRIVVEAVQRTLDFWRRKIEGFSANQVYDPVDISAEKLAGEAAELAIKTGRPRLRPVINATGVILHTNLGRAPLAASAADAVQRVAASYSNLELDLESGGRGSRQDHLEQLLCSLSGAEAAFVLNNNAAAVLLALNTFAREKEVIVSRGQLVEIGGSFRLPEVMAASGARMVEVGTTNKVYLSDYEAAINEKTAILLKVNTSNYQVIGFTAGVSAAELVSLASSKKILAIEDLGSGVLMQTAGFNLPPEPGVQESIAAGVDLVTFSGDKLLGGPQAGIILGRRELVDLLRKNHLARALRVDKLTVAALEATLRLYLDEKAACREIPVWRMLSASPELIKKRAGLFARRLKAAIADGSASVKVIAGSSRVGGGALPLAELPTYLVAVQPATISVTGLAERLRAGELPVIARLQHDCLLLDLRTVAPEEEKVVAKALRRALEEDL
jgi:L-seryl-tRNA(Ser) seleniumtransferase